MRDTALSGLASASRHDPRAGLSDPEILSVVFVQFLAEAMVLYQARALCRRLGELGHIPSAPPNDRVFSTVLAGVPPPADHPLLRKLAEGFPATRRPGPPAWMGRVVQESRLQGLSLSVLLPRDRGRDILAIDHSTLITHHARTFSGRVRPLNYREFFAEPVAPGPSSRAGEPLAGPLLDLALAAVDRGFRAGNESLPGFLARYLRDWLARATGLVRARLVSLLRRRSDLPLRLWTGSGANIWSRVLRHAVREAGGSVTGHDHGSGAGHIDGVAKTVADFESSDEFVTYTQTQVRLLEREMRSDLLTQAVPPRIRSVESPRAVRLPRAWRRRPRARGGKKSVLYPSTFYNGERMHFMVQIPDVVAVDWEARLFARLCEWGYDVVLKPHPDSVSPPPDVYTRDFGVRIRSEPFERVMGEADVILSISSLSTAFFNALLTDLPIVFVDFGLVSWLPEARAVFEKRCPVVHGWFDENRRAQVDWPELREAIERAPSLKDDAFRQEFVGSLPH